MVTKFAYLLTDVMEQAGVGTNRLAAELDVSPSSVSHWRAGRVEPTPSHVRAMAEVLGVGADRLFVAMAGDDPGTVDVPRRGPEWVERWDDLSPSTRQAIELLVQADLSDC